MAAFYSKGLYAGECIEQFMGQSDSGKKTPYLGLRFKILARIENEQEVACADGERTVYLYLSDAAMEIAIEAITHLGYDKDSLKFLNPNQPGFYNFAGKVCDLWCGIEEYQGKTKEKWSISTPRERKAVTPVDDKELRRLDSLFGKAIRAKRGPGIPAVAPPATPSGNGVIPGVSPQQAASAGVGRSDPTQPPTLDEIPF